jgi:hypothetical protein
MGRPLPQEIQLGEGLLRTTLRMRYPELIALQEYVLCYLWLVGVLGSPKSQ